MPDAQVFERVADDPARARARQALRTRVRLGAWQAGLVLAALAIWEFGTRIPLLSDNLNIFDAFFVSRPSEVLARLWEWTLGAKAGCCSARSASWRSSSTPSSSR
jgi:hypothetical protein